jgi:hypothetical protein
MKTPSKPAVVVTTETHRPISPDDDLADRGRSVDESPNSGLRELELLARWMDSVFVIPGYGIRFGFDAILGLVPWLGDTATSLVSLYILQEASKRGISRVTQARMAANIIIDYVVGSIPLVGDVFDVYWKANQKNVALLRQYTTANPTSQRRLETSDWLFFGGVALVIMALLAGSMTMSYFLIRWIWSLGAA